MSDVWTDPVTGSTVETTEHWWYIKRDTTTKAVPRTNGVWTGTPENAGIIRRWLDAHEGEK